MSAQLPTTRDAMNVGPVSATLQSARVALDNASTPPEVQSVRANLDVLRAVLLASIHDPNAKAEDVAEARRQLEGLALEAALKLGAMVPTDVQSGRPATEKPTTVVGFSTVADVAKCSGVAESTLRRYRDLAAAYKARTEEFRALAEAAINAGENLPIGKLIGLVRAPKPAKDAERLERERLEAMAREQQAAEDRARAERNKHRDGRDSRPSSGGPHWSDEEKAERQRKAAEDRVRHEADLEAMRRAEDRKPGPEPKKDAGPVEPYSVSETAHGLAGSARDLARRIGLFGASLGAVHHYPLPCYVNAQGEEVGDPRLADMREIIAGFAPLFAAAVAAEKWAPRLEDHGAMDAEMVQGEVARLEAQAKDDEAARRSLAKRKAEPALFGGGA